MLTIICCGACFETPEEWREAIQSICKAAEASVFPHPSSDAQCLYGTHEMGAQVRNLKNCL